MRHASRTVPRASLPPRLDYLTSQLANPPSSELINHFVVASHHDRPPSHTKFLVHEAPPSNSLHSLVTKVHSLPLQPTVVGIIHQSERA